MPRGVDSMANQQNPNTYALMCRCPLKDAAAARALAGESGLTLSGFVANLIHERVRDVDLSERDKKWIAKKYRINKKIRARADRKAATVAGKSFRRNKV